MGEDSRAEIVRVARELKERLEAFEGLTDLLADALPRLVEPAGDADFEAAVAQLTGRLDEDAIGQLGRLVDELWLYRPESLMAVRRPSSYDGVVAGTERGGLHATVEYLLDVANWASAAAVGGVLGNRADAAVAALFDSVRQSRRRRRAARQDALTRAEAVDVAVAAAGTIPERIPSEPVVVAVEQRDGDWKVTLKADRVNIAIDVPPGDPDTARIVIRVS